MSEVKGITNVGLDVHKGSINVAVIVPGSKRVDEEWQLSNDARARTRMVRKLKRMGSDHVRVCYEAGPCGYALQRELRDAGLGCVVVAPSLIPSKPGERVKTDPRDARKLVELFRAGLLTEVHPPTPEEEAVRDLTRAREDGKRDLLSARHRLSKMLLRQGYVYRDGNNWTKRHRAWIKSIRFELREQQAVLDNYILSVEQIDFRFVGDKQMLLQSLIGVPYVFRGERQPDGFAGAVLKGPAEHVEEDKKTGLAAIGQTDIFRSDFPAVFVFQQCSTMVDEAKISLRGIIDASKISNGWVALS